MVPLVPPSWESFVVSISGPVEVIPSGFFDLFHEFYFFFSILILFKKKKETICWGLHSIWSGGKGVTYQILTENDELRVSLSFTEIVGWEGAGKAEVCIEGGSWGQLSVGQNYTFQVVGTSVLFGTTATSSFTFTLSSSSFSRSLLSSSSRQEMTNCDPFLWDPSPSSLYGLQTFPSGTTILPPSLRYVPLTITTKALSPCAQNGMSKDILAPSNFTWEFIGVGGSGGIEIDLNEYANGTRLVIPQEILENRDIFPPNEPVGVTVIADFGEEIVFHSELSIQFVSSPVEMKVQSGFKSIFDVDEDLVIDFSDSYTLDGGMVGEDGWDWEWDWSCLIPGEKGEQGKKCVYEGGDVVQMPGEGEARFQGERGKKFEEGVPLFFFVKSRVRRGGEVVGEGEWSQVVNPIGGEGVGLELVEDMWMCEDSSVGYLVFFFSYFFFCLHLAFIFSFCSLLMCAGKTFVS